MDEKRAGGEKSGADGNMRIPLMLGGYLAGLLRERCGKVARLEVVVKLVVEAVGCRGWCATRER
jgi:hypothetical protein